VEVPSAVVMVPFSTTLLTRSSSTRALVTPTPTVRMASRQDEENSPQAFRGSPLVVRVRNTIT
jgi:hypothetical protein